MCENFLGVQNLLRKSHHVNLKINMSGEIFVTGVALKRACVRNAKYLLCYA
jgi:hypothetical protein